MERCDDGGKLTRLAVLFTLALYWTSVKAEYREYVTGAAETQQIRVPLGERMAYISGDKALNMGDIAVQPAS